MSDASLRALERTARSSRSPDDVLRWAAELDRVGRADEALEALCLSRDDAGTRAALVARPASPGPPMLQEPVERFRVKLAGSDQAKLIGAGPLGVVIGSKARTRVLDPDSGETRVTLAGAAWQGVLRDLVLRVRGQPALLEAHDVWTGELLHTTRLEGKTGCTWVGRNLLISGRMGSLHAYAFASTRRPPERVWEVKLPDHPGPVCLTEDRALVTIAFGGRFGLVVDSATGRVLREVPSRDRFVEHARWLAAAHGIGLALDGREPTLSAFGLQDGRELWSSDAHALRTVAVGPGLVLVAREDEVARLDAATGAPVGDPLRTDALDEPAGVDALLPGRDVDYLVAAGRGDVLAWRRSRGIAWRWAPRPSLHIMGAAAVLGRLYLVCGRATIVCLDRPVQDPFV